MPQLSRDHMKVLCDLFDRYALKDQNNYYQSAVKQYRQAGAQVNLIQALFAFVAGIASALVALGTGSANWSQGVITFLIAVAVIAPALSVAFSSLAELYQWNRLVPIYESSRKSLIFADAHSPVDSVKTDEEYRRHMDTFVAVTLDVMREETSQWGQLIKPPETTVAFIKESQARVDDLTASPTIVDDDEEGG